ncbi:MAG: hydrogenase 4 subunit B [Euryarchaeota archaeon]|nr:hydrogenase 4 subunit B [Euryarchaeota archaeon]
MIQTNFDVLFQSLICILFSGALVAVLLHKLGRPIAWISFAIAFIGSLLGILLSIDVILNDPITLGWSLGTFFGEWTLYLDQLSAFFLFMVCLVMASVSVYSFGYVGEYEGKYDTGLMGALLNLFFLSLVLVVSSNNAILFLISWESMSLVSFLLVMYEGRKEGVTNAGYLYLTMTHIGTAVMTAAFLLMAYYVGSYSFDDISAASGSLPSSVSSAAFLFLFIGLGTKAGMVPLHVWLPAAHPAAPSNISALMSGVMVKMALFMMVRSFFEFLGPVPSWWGLLVLLMGCISALLGVLYALKETDIKSTLAYSTVENMGIMFIGLGTAMVFQSYGLTSLSALALLATLFHALNHAIFKSLLFLGAGSVVHATHTRNMESMGGLAKPMPRTSVLMFVGLLSMAAIPPLGGFVSEWLLFQSLLQTTAVPDILVKMLMSVSIAILALTGALAVAMAVRLFGTTFLARPRTEQAKNAVESPKTMLWGMSFLAALCILLGVLSSWIIPYIDNVTESVLGVSIGSSVVDGLSISPESNDFATMAPLLIALLALIGIVMAWVLGHPKSGTERTSGTWDCGTPLSSRNEYTGTALSNPIVRVFGNIYRPQSEIRTESTSSPYIRKRLFYEVHFGDVFERRIYHPITILFTGIAKRMTVIQAGSIQAYLGYIFMMLVLLLVVFR